MTKKEEFIKIFNKHITLDGAEDLLAYLKKSDFFTAPASTRFHLSCTGGLCEHSINVYNRLQTLATTESNETLAICGLLHDVCKANFYTETTRNVKNEQGVWEKVPYYAVDDQFPYGHGEKSVYIIRTFIKLTAEESMAIRWHMGGFDESVKGGSYAISGAYEKFGLCAKLASADLLATYIDEKSTRGATQ